MTSSLANMRASKTPIALGWEDTYAMYYGNRQPCDYRMVGNFHPSATGWAVKKGHKLLPAINKALTELNSTGEIQRMVDKWWKGDCPEEGSGTETSGSDRVALVTFGTIVFVLVLSITSRY